MLLRGILQFFSIKRTVHLEWLASESTYYYIRMRFVLFGLYPLLHFSVFLSLCVGFRLPLRLSLQLFYY